jgi:hypothetical protein
MEDAVLMGCDPEQVRSTLRALVEDLERKLGENR